MFSRSGWQYSIDNSHAAKIRADGSAPSEPECESKYREQGPLDIEIVIIDRKLKKKFIVQCCHHIGRRDCPHSPPVDGAA